MKKPALTESPVTEGQRLRLLRKALAEEKASSLARRLGISASRWSNVESGGKPIGRDFAHKLVRAVPGLSVDWLWFGEKPGLSYELARRLDDAESDEKANLTG